MSIFIGRWWWAGRVGVSCIFWLCVFSYGITYVIFSVIWQRWGWDIVELFQKIIVLEFKSTPQKMITIQNDLEQLIHKLLFVSFTQCRKFSTSDLLKQHRICQYRSLYTHTQRPASSKFSLCLSFLLYSSAAAASFSQNTCQHSISVGRSVVYRMAKRFAN